MGDRKLFTDRAIYLYLSVRVPTSVAFRWKVDAVGIPTSWRCTCETMPEVIRSVLPPTEPRVFF